MNVYEMASQMTVRAQLNDHVNTTMAAAKEALMTDPTPAGVNKAMAILDAAEARYTTLTAALA
jgi:hypothetical protein